MEAPLPFKFSEFDHLLSLSFFLTFGRVWTANKRDTQNHVAALIVDIDPKGRQTCAV